jgi:hypothetical protein
VTLQKITADDIASWDSLEDISSSLEKRGLKTRPTLGEDNELVMELSDDEFVVLIEADKNSSPSDYRSRMDAAKHTNLVATHGYDEFTFTTRRRSFDEHGRIRYQQFSFEKDEFTSDSGKKYSALDKLNELEHGEPYKVYELYDKREVVKEFYEQFEELRRELIQEVKGIPEDRGDAKQRYVQVQLDRLIFLYFIQKKNLLDFNPNYLEEKHEEFAEEGDVFEEFYKPLFFDILGEGKRRTEFGNPPYLNGGLFSKSPVEEEFEEARLGEPGETEELYADILDFLGDWNWHVDERLDIVDEKNLSPEVLGHIFEQTVNQKEMGAYYTPEEITSFMARNTIHPYLVDQLNEKVDAEYEELDEVFALSGDGSPGEAVADGGLARIGSTDSIQRDHVETLYFDVLKETHVLDPAVGSGAFLLAAQDVLLDVYLSCLDYFLSIPSYDRMGIGRIQDELEEIEESGSSPTLHAKYEIILNNLYGVDIDDGAVEICKLRLWLSMVADIENDPDEVEALPNIDFNIRQGNSLIGFTDLVETSSDGDAKLNNWGAGVGDSVREKYEDIIEAVENHKEAENSEDAANWRKIAESRLETYRSDLNSKVLEEFHRAGLEDMDIEQVDDFSPFHWVLEFAEVYQNGGFGVIIGNPPWDMLYANRDDFFVRYDGRFRTYSSDKKDEVVESLTADELVKREWEEYQEMIEKRADYYTKGDTYELQSPTVGGRKMPTKSELSALFLERAFELSNSGTQTSLLLPGTIYGSVMGKDLRIHLVENASLRNIIGFENKGIFEDIDDRYRFGILTFNYGGETENLVGIFNEKSVEIVHNIEEKAASIPQEVLMNYSPEGRIFPFISSPEEVDVLSKIVSQPPLSETVRDAWSVDILTKELVESNDKDKFVKSSERGDYPVYGGKNIHQFEHDNSHMSELADPEYWSRDTDNPGDNAKHRIREKKFNRGNLKRAIYETFGGEETSKSQKSFVNELLEDHRGKELNIDDVLLDCQEYRIGIRDVTNSTNERTIIASVLPKGVVCLHTINTFKPFEINPEREHLSEDPLRSPYVRRFTDEELFAATGLLNSIPFDFLMRTKVETHIIKYELLESQMPRLTKGDEYFEYIWKRAARLNCYGDEFEEMRERLGGIEPATTESERRELQAEIDAAAFHAYGLDQEETHYVLDNFHRVENPRMMTDEYFELVKEKYADI